MAIPSPVIWSDLDQGLFQDGQGNLATVFNENSVRTSIDNILGTWQGERIFLPQFASNLKGLLFEPITQSLLNRMADNIKATITRWDNRVVIEGVDISTDSDHNYITIGVRFSIPGVSQILTQTTKIGA